MEHEYYIPQQDEVENFIDVVELFLAATGRFIKKFLVQIELENYGKNNYGDISLEFASIKLDPNSSIINISTEFLNTNPKTTHGEAKYEKDQINNKIKEAEKNGEKVLLPFAVEQQSYRIIINKYLLKNELTVTAKEDNYPNWISMYLNHVL